MPYSDRPDNFKDDGHGMCVYSHADEKDDVCYCEPVSSKCIMCVWRQLFTGVCVRKGGRR